MTTKDAPTYQPGDVVYGADPYKGDEAARPWLVLSNHIGKPFHGEQYISLSLTTKSWMEGLIEIAETDWTYGGTPEESRIIPWAIQSIDRDDIDYWQGRLAEDIVNVATESFIDYLRG